MSVQVAAIVLSWVAIAVLTAALAACVRSIRFQEARLLQVLSQPRRLVPGDTLRLPRPLAGAISAEPACLLLLGTAQCASCVQALHHLAGLQGATDRAPRILALFREAAPSERELPLTGQERIDVFDYQAEAFEDLNIGLLPFAVLVQRDEVLAAGAVGSPDSIAHLWKAAERASVRAGLPLLDTTERQGGNGCKSATRPAGGIRGGVSSRARWPGSGRCRSP